MFYKVEHVMDGKVDDILVWLAKEMQIIENYEGVKERVVLHARRDGNKIVVAGTLYEINDASMPTKISGFDEYEGFIFDVSRINDTRSLITGYIAVDNIFIKNSTIHTWQDWEPRLMPSGKRKQKKYLKPCKKRSRKNRAGIGEMSRRSTRKQGRNGFTMEQKFQMNPNWHPLPKRLNQQEWTKKYYMGRT